MSSIEEKDALLDTQQVRRSLHRRSHVSALDGKVALRVEDSFVEAYLWLTRMEAIELATEIMDAANSLRPIESPSA